MNRSLLLIAIGCVVLMFGVLAGKSSQTKQLLVEKQQSEGNSVTAGAEQMPTVAPAPVGDAPTPLPEPTDAPAPVLSYSLTNNTYRDSFSSTQSGWEPQYRGDDNAWNGYTPAGYSFQLGTSYSRAGGRRLWDINTCCVLPAQYVVRFDVESVSPQRGMIIADMQGNVFDINTGTAILILFDIGYPDDLRYQPIRVFQLVRGNAVELGCSDTRELVVSQRMHIDVTVTGEYVAINFQNPDRGQFVSPVCRVEERSYGQGLLGIGVVRSAVSDEYGISRLNYTSFELTEIASVRGDPQVTPPSQWLTVRCTGAVFSSFDSWLEESLNRSCQSD